MSPGSGGAIEPDCVQSGDWWPARVLAAVARNLGVLVDACDDWSTSTADAAEVAAQFETTWSALWPRFAHLDGRESP